MRDRGMIGPTLTRLGSNSCAVAWHWTQAGGLGLGSVLPLAPRIYRAVSTWKNGCLGLVPGVGDALCGGTASMKVTLDPKARSRLTQTRRI